MIGNGSRTGGDREQPQPCGSDAALSIDSFENGRIFLPAVAVHWYLPEAANAREVLWYAFGDDDLGGFWSFEVDVALFNLSGARLSIDGAVRDDPWMFSTGLDRALWIEKGPGQVLLVKFMRGALYRLFGICGDETFGRVIAADPARFPGLAAMDAALRAAPPQPAQQAAALDTAVRPWAQQAVPEGPAEAFRYLAHQRRGAIRVAKGAALLGIAPRTLERHCRQRFGRSPAQVIRLVRYAAALTPQLEHGTPGWRGVPSEVPYADQSHFLRDARQLVGQPPSRWPGPARPIEAHFHARGAMVDGHDINAEQAAADWRAAIDRFHYGEASSS